VEVAADHADQASGDYLLWAKSQREDFESLVGQENALPDNRINAPQAWRTAVPEELYSTTWVAQRAEEYLNQHAKSDQPFFLQMSFPDPHHPFTPPGKYWDMYDPEDIELPESFGKGDLPPIKAMKEALERGEDKRDNQSPFAVTENEASSIDISTTILARAGIQPFNGIQGRDLLTDKLPEAIMVEEDSQRLMIGFDRLQRVRTLVTKKYRMSVRQGEDWGELYDLENDPHEINNLFDDAASQNTQGKWPCKNWPHKVKTNRWSLLIDGWKLGLRSVRKSLSSRRPKRSD